MVLPRIMVAAIAAQAAKEEAMKSSIKPDK
jgi:hypothetical protein